MSDYESVDFFIDASLIPDPYRYFDHPRERCPVMSRPEQGVVAITGHQEALAVYKDPAFARRYPYEPTWQMRGPTELHVGFTPIA